MMRLCRSLIILAVVLALGTPFANASQIISISGTYGAGPTPSGSNIVLDGSPAVTGSSPTNSLAGASVSQLQVTLGTLSTMVLNLGGNDYYGGSATLKNFSDPSHPATMVFTQGSNSATFTFNNPVNITIVQPSDGSFLSDGTISQTNAATLTSSNFADLSSIGSLWDLRISFQGNFRGNPGSPGTFTFGTNYTSSGSFTISQHGAFAAPEPASIVTFGVLGVVGAMVARRRKNQQPVV